MANYNISDLVSVTTINDADTFEVFQSGVNKKFTGTQLKTYLDSMSELPSGLWRLRGNYNGATNLFPTTGGTGVGAAIESFNVWVITSYGIVGSTDLSVGSFLIALVDNPGQDETKWRVL